MGYTDDLIKDQNYEGLDQFFEGMKTINQLYNGNFVKLIPIYCIAVIKVDVCYIKYWMFLFKTVFLINFIITAVGGKKWNQFKISHYH